MKKDSTMRNNVVISTYRRKKSR